MMIELNRIYQGNCIQLMKTIPNKIIDLIITSPPYNCGKNYLSYTDEVAWVDYYKFIDAVLNATTAIRISGAGTGILANAVGSTTTITVPVAPAHIVATGEFTDGTQQVLLDTSI